MTKERLHTPTQITKQTHLLGENGERVQERYCELPDVAGQTWPTAWERELNHPELGIVKGCLLLQKKTSDYVRPFLCKVKT